MPTANEIAASQAAMMNLEIFKVVPTGKEDHPRGTCEGCGLHLWSEGGYRVPGLKGLFCSLVCIECGIAEKTGQKKGIAGAPIGSGARLLLYLKAAAPGIYLQLAQSDQAFDPKRCLECGTPLNGKRADSRFCGHAHQMRFSRKSSTVEKPENSRHMPIGKQGLTDAQNSGSMNTLTRPIQAL
jgi:hypothetical protein